MDARSPAARLAYTAGSPFSRMARVCIREWALPVEEAEVAFPPPPETFAVNPLGQVPLLTVGDEAVFPTLLILERLWSMAGRPRAAYDDARDRQVLVTLLQAGDALVAAYYQRWAGLGPVRPNLIGYDPAERHLGRVRATLAWLEPRSGELGAAVTLPGTVLACLLLWAAARDGLGSPVPPGLGEVVGRLQEREAFKATEPPPWRPSGTA